MIIDKLIDNWPEATEKPLAMASQLTSNVLIILFNGFNTLDVNGPYEVLRKSGRSDIFKVTIASQTEITTSIEGVHIKVQYLRTSASMTAYCLEK